MINLEKPATLTGKFAIESTQELFIGTFDNADAPTPGYMARTLDAIKEGASVAGFLRIGGAALMVFSLSLFLVQGVDATSDLHRYLLLLGQTVLLTTAGFGVGFLLKEPRGARVFFSLALISIPANFAVLGAMIYSIVPLDSVLATYPRYAKWTSTDVNELLIAGAAALIVLVPMCIFCFSVMARQSKVWLSVGYLLACSTLLIPMRDTMNVTVISSVCALAMALLLARLATQSERLSTGEERFAKTLLFAPAALMLARSAMLYGVDFHVAMSIVIASHYFLRRSVVRMPCRSVLRTFLQVLSAFSAIFLATMLTSLASSMLSLNDPFLVFAALLLALNIDLARLVENGKIGKVIHGIWAVLCFTAIMTDSLQLNDYFELNTYFILTILLTVASALTKQKLGIVLSLLSMVVIVMFNSAYFFDSLLDTGWVGMAIAGASTIVAGSLLERYWPVIKLRWQQHFTAQLQL